MLNYGFMARALEAGAVLGIIYPMLGSFLVLRRYAFMADTISHISLAGVALGLWLGVSLAFSPLLTIAVAIIGALVADKLRSGQKISPDALLALVMSSGVALASILFGLARSAPVDITSYLFGALLTVSPQEVWVILAVSAAALVILIVLFKDFFFICYDEELARVSGLPVEFLNLTCILLVAVTVAVGLRVVGSLLVSALMVIPVLASLLVARSFRQVVFIAAGIGFVSSIIGLVLSYYLGLAAGGSIALVALCFFLVLLMVKKGQGLFSSLHS